jgi:CheY-like chemotaxis protein
VKQLVALHDGSVHAHSDGPDRGSTFTVTLPVSGPTTAASAAPQTTNAADRPLQGRRVLLVDDNRDFVTGLTRLLEGLGAEVGVAYDGSSGLEAAAAQRWHLVFLDIGLPDVDGTEVARRMRTIPEGAPDRLVALTGYSDPATQQRIADAGFDEHLVKPVDTEILKRLISGE